MANLGFRRALAALGIRMVETPVGDRHVAEALERTGGVLGGEPSGHVIFRKFLGTGDGLLTAVQVLDVMKRTGRPLSALAALAVKLPQILVNVPIRERRPIGEMKGFSRELRRIEAHLNGTGRVLIRYSGTEPLLRIMVEGPSAEVVETAARSLARAAGN
jgi:phosphoglucosamine mutase